MTFPYTVKQGSALVKVYKTPVRVKGKRYSAFTVRFYFDGKPVQKKFGSAEKALKFADESAKRIDQGQAGAWLFSEQDKQAFNRAVEFLAPLEKAVDIAAHEYAEATKILGGVSIIEAARFYRSRHPENFTIKTTREVFEEMLAFKAQDGLSKLWLRELRLRVGRFVEKFPGSIRDVSGIQIEDWLRSLGIAARSRNNVRLCLSAYFNFAKSRKYLPKDFDELSAVPVAKPPHKAIEIFTPEEMEKLLGAAKKQDVPYLAIGAFAGVRTAELSRLDWSEVGVDHIEIKASKAKTAARRLVPVLPNLATWLESVRKTSGLVWNYANQFMHSDAITRLEDASGVTWKKNALRHSFISYRLAAIQNTAQVALEAGTSERKIFSNYREIVTPSAAKEWFGIFYKPVTNRKPKKAK